MTSAGAKNIRRVTALVLVALSLVAWRVVGPIGLLPAVIGGVYLLQSLRPA